MVVISPRPNNKWGNQAVAVPYWIWNSSTFPLKAELIRARFHAPWASKSGFLLARGSNPNRGKVSERTAFRFPKKTTWDGLGEVLPSTGAIYRFIITVCNYTCNNDIQLLNWQVYGIPTAGKTGDWEALAGPWENAIGISLKRINTWLYPLKDRESVQFLLHSPGGMGLHCARPINSTRRVCCQWWGLQGPSTYMQLVKCFKSFSYD